MILSNDALSNAHAHPPSHNIRKAFYGDSCASGKWPQRETQNNGFCYLGWGTWEKSAGSLRLGWANWRMVWDNFGLHWILWDLLSIIWDHLGSSGTIWEHLGSSPIMWDRMGSSWLTWDRLVSFRIIGDALRIHLGSLGGAMREDLSEEKYF